MKKINKSYKSEKVAMVNSSGEIVSEGTLNFTENSKQGREKGYFTIYNDEFDRLTTNLTSKELFLLNYCVKNRNQKTNIVNLGKKNILKKLNMQRQNFWTYKNKLIKENFIVETDTKNQYLINPKFCCSTSSDTYMDMKLAYANHKADQDEINRVKEEIKNSKNKDKLQKIDKCINDNVFNINDLIEYLKTINIL